MEERKFLNPDDVVNVWGPDFAPLTLDKNIRFTETEIAVKLSRPLKVGDGEPVSEIFVHEPNVSEMKQTDAAQGEISKAAILLRVLAEIPQASVNAMRGRDFIRVNQVLGLFLADSP